jgi:acyl-CoA synthetase (AMP-forming)/AMP-acid ligase II
MNVAALLAKAAHNWGGRPALRQGSVAFSYAELEQRSASVAAGFQRLGLQKGDRLGIWSPNRPEIVVALFAAFRAGLTAVPVNARLHPNEVTYILENCGASALVLDPGLEPAELPQGVQALSINELPQAPSAGMAETAPDDPAWLFYTSGTTGRPKGATLTHGNLVAMTMNCLADLYSFQPEDRVLHAAPLSHGSGLFILPPVARGSFNLIAPAGTFDPAAIFDTVEREAITAVAFLAPTQIVAMLNHPDAGQAKLGSLRGVIYGGGPMYVEHIRRALELWGPIFIQLYGQGETPMTGTYLRREDHLGEGEEQARRLGSVGIPRTDVELRIVDADDRPVPAGEVGEITIRAATVMKGYWGDSESSAETVRNGWLHTGDLGYQDPDGYVHLVDRAKDMIITGGNNVYAREVEEVILRHPGVVEVAVVGVRDDYWGEAVHAVVVARDPTLTGEEVIAHCRGSLASYKKPKVVHFATELPKSAYGKVLKRELRGRLAAGSPV